MQNFFMLVLQSVRMQTLQILKSTDMYILHVTVKDHTYINICRMVEKNIKKKINLSRASKKFI